MSYILEKLEYHIYRLSEKYDKDLATRYLINGGLIGAGAGAGAAALGAGAYRLAKNTPIGKKFLIYFKGSPTKIALGALGGGGLGAITGGIIGDRKAHKSNPKVYTKDFIRGK